MAIVILAICGLFVGAFLLSSERFSVIGGLIAVTLPWIMLLLIDTLNGSGVEIKMGWQYYQKITIPVITYLLIALTSLHVMDRIKNKRAERV